MPRVSQILALMANKVTQQPSIGTPPTIMSSVNNGFAVTYTPASGISGIPVPTVEYDLYKNGALLIANYITGTYLAESPGDQLQIVATADNGIGLDAVATSAVLTVGTAPPIGAPSFVNASPFDATSGLYYFYPFTATNSPTSYTVASGSLPPGITLSSAGRLSGWPTTAGSYTFTVSATNASGTATTGSITMNTAYQARLKQAPYVGVPLYYEIPNFSGTITSQQWYKNTGSGPVAISGATGATYTPVSGDVGAHLSVRCVTSSGNINSIEFSATGQVISQTAVLQAPSTTSYISSLHNGATVNTVCKIRGIFGNYYVETTVAPGTYTSAQLGNTLLTAAGLSGYSDFSATGGMWSSISMPPVQAAPANRAAATATRPVANTGIGNFVANGTLYDGNGNKFIPRGVNWTHWDLNCLPQMIVAGMNCIRYEYYHTNAWSITKSALDSMVAGHVIPIIAHFFNGATGLKGTCSGNTLTLTQRTTGYLYVGMVVTMAGLPGGKATITSIGSTNGGLGDYTINGAGATITTETTITVFDYVTGGSLPQQAQTAVRNIIDLYPQMSAYDGVSIINLANEWGPSGSSTNTVWRDTWGYKDSGGTVHSGAVQTLRAAGYRGCIMIDAPGNGQDTYALINHAASVLAADPLQNIMFGFHIYAGAKAGALAGVLDQIRATGITLMLSEYGSGAPNAPDANCCIDPLNIIADAENRDWGAAAWSWDNHHNANPPEFDGWYTLAYDWINGYKTGLASDLNIFGKKVILDPVYGSSISTKATTV